MPDLDADALLRAIVRHPDDDTPRLVYADWLQENDRPEEAEFLRVQCWLAATEPADPMYAEWLEREEELRLWLSTHVPGPRPTFPAGLSVEGGNWWWPYTARGFPRFLQFDGTQKYGARAMRALASALERAFDALPTRWLVVRDITTAQLAALLKHPVLERVKQLTAVLSVYGDEADESARLLARCRHLRNLSGLSLGFAPGDAGCEALASGPWENLEWFSPTCHMLGGFGIRALGAANWFRGLRDLSLDTLEEGALWELVRLEPLSRLHTLNLTAGLFALPAWGAFAASRTFPALQKLNLDDSDLSRHGFAGLTGASRFALRVLTASACGLPPGAGAALAAAPCTGSLHTLDLSRNALPVADTRAIVGCKRFTGLRRLNLAGSALGPSGLQALAANPALRGLRSLNLASWPPYTRGLMPTYFDRFLTKLNVPDLRHLDLSGQPVGAKAARKLADPKFGSLTRLGLHNCRLSDPAVSAILDAPSLSNLIQIELSYNGLQTAPEKLTDRRVLPRLAACSLDGNALSASAVRRLRKRPGVRV